MDTDPRILALKELVEKTIHSQYALVRVLNRAVAFHYGNMPQLVRTEIERLFRDGQIAFLVCTSTLLEGVNLPCKNLFARGPHRGVGNVMSVSDFWNLAGRAGRWGKEFQGNIVCVDTDNAKVWPELPQRRVRAPITRAIDTIRLDPDGLVQYIRSKTPVSDSRTHPLLESIFSYLVSLYLHQEDIREIPGLKGTLEDVREQIASAVSDSMESVELPRELILRHEGISPYGMQRLLDRCRAAANPEDLIVPLPESNDAVESYAAALSLVSETLGGSFGSSGRQMMLAILIVDWMRGRPLARLIINRIQYLERRDRSFKLATVIRETMTDVEQYARFQAPKYLSCYVDVLRLHLTAIGRTETARHLPDLSMFLELGVSRTTEFSLMSLGLSRTSAIAVSEYIAEDELSVEECSGWLRSRDLDSLDLPVLVREEVRRALSV